MGSMLIPFCINSTFVDVWNIFVFVEINDDPRTGCKSLLFGRIHRECSTTSWIASTSTTGKPVHLSLLSINARYWNLVYFVPHTIIRTFDVPLVYKSCISSSRNIELLSYGTLGKQIIGSRPHHRRGCHPQRRAVPSNLGAAGPPMYIESASRNYNSPTQPSEISNLSYSHFTRPYWGILVSFFPPLIFMLKFSG